MKLLLFLLLVFAALASTAMGLLMITSPGGESVGLSPALLSNSSFGDFRKPGILVILLLALPCYLALLALMRAVPRRYNWSIAVALVIICWGIALIIFLTVAHWLPYVVLATGLLVMLVSFQLKGKWLL